MKKIFLLIAGSTLCFSQSRGQATETKDVSAFMYSIDNITHCHVVDVAPGSEVEFYSERWGGKLIRQDNISATGMLEISEKGFSPAFVLNKKTNQVFFMEPVEFSIEKMHLKRSGSNNTISWEGTANPDKDISFDVLTSSDGITYEIAESVTATKSAGISRYTVDHAGTEGNYYKIKVNNKKEGTRYSSHPMRLGAKDVLVYPSIVTTSLTINLLTEQTDAGFSISNINGQVVRNGKLTQGTNTLNLTELASGTYIVNVSGGSLNTSEKIVKQ